MTNRKILSLIVLTLLILNINTFPIVLKIGSLAPKNTPWDNALQKINSEWKRISNNKISLRIYPGGIAGDEENMIRKIKIGQLDGAAITGVGLSRIYSGILALQLPRLIRTDDELFYVLKKMKPYFEKELEKKGIKVIIWTKVGWVHFFSKEKVVTPEDFKKHKLFVYSGDPDGIQAWKDAGFNVVPLQPTDIMTSLQSGMINAFSTTPLSAASYQWFGLAKNMCAMKWAPLIGGVIISTKKWKKLPPTLRLRLEKAAEKIGREMQAEIDKADAQAVEIMKQNGLTVNEVPPEIQKEWEKTAIKAYTGLINKSFDEKSYNLIKKYLEEYRNKHGQK